MFTYICYLIKFSFNILFWFFKKYFYFNAYKIIIASEW